MSLRNRLGQLFARQTQPDQDRGRPIARIPVKRGNIIVTHDKALELATCFACVRVISEDVAKLPWNVFAHDGEMRRKLDNSPLSRLLNTRPNPDMGSFTFRETLIAWALTWGNGYAEIERDIAGRPVALWPVGPDRVDPKRAEDGRIVYEIHNSHGARTILEQRDMFHVHGLGFDGLSGYSMVGLAAQTLGFALAAEEHGASFYGNNTTPGLALKTDGTLSDEGYNRLKDEIADRKGSARAYEGMILEQGLDFAIPNMSQVDAQYVETRRQTVEEVCRWWRVPPHKVQELSRAHFNNVENLNINYATDTLMPWIKRLEEEADWKLIGSRSQASFTKIAIQALMRGDSAARSGFYKEMFQMGVFSQNMILALEDMDPIGPEGDEHYIQSQFTTLKKINEDPEPVPEQTPEQTAEQAIDALAIRLMTSEVNKAESAVNRYDRDGFVEWMDIQNDKSRFSRTRAFAALEQVVNAAYQNDFDLNLAVQAYVDAERMELLAIYDGQQPDYMRVTTAVLEAIK